MAAVTTVTKKKNNKYKIHEAVLYFSHEKYESRTNRCHIYTRGKRQATERS